MAPTMSDVEPLDRPGSNFQPAEKETNTAETMSPEQAGYTSSAERCHSCEYFDAEGMNCKKYNFAAEPDGHCDAWEAAGGGAETSDTPEDEGMEDDFEPLG